MGKSISEDQGKHIAFLRTFLGSYLSPPCFFRVDRTYSNNDVYEGEFVDNLKHGVGTLRYYNTGDRYEGEFERDFLHGYGVYIWATVVDEENNVISGRRYEGYWKEGKMHGQGIYKLGNGDVYTGSFVNDRFEGKGTMKYANGDFFEGEWLRGLPGGHMKVTYVNGDSYEGSMSVGKYEGKGKFIFHNELGSYDGDWSMGLYHGHGVRVYSDSAMYVGHFRNGELFSITISIILRLECNAQGFTCFVSFAVRCDR